MASYFLIEESYLDRYSAEEFAFLNFTKPSTACSSITGAFVAYFGQATMVLLGVWEVRLV